MFGMPEELPQGSINLFPLGIYELTFYKRPDSELGKLNQAYVIASET